MTMRTIHQLRTTPSTTTFSGASSCHDGNAIRKVCVSAFAVLAFSFAMAPNAANGQAGFREALEKLDRDDNGKIDPDEITALARPYLEKVYAQRRLPMNKPQDIERIQEASRIYHAIQNGVAGERVRLDSAPRIRDFEPDDEQEIIPGFGLAKIKYPYTQDDLDEADQTLRRYDRNNDGYIDRGEARRARWTHRDPFEMDLNLDDRLSRLELSQRYARRRLLKDDSGELIQRARRVGSGVEPVSRNRDDDDDRGQWWRRGGSRYWLTASMLGRFDKNRNGRLEAQESTDLNLPISQIDTDRDGDLSRDELNFYLTSLQDEIGDDAEGLPGWFYELDTDRDGQVSMPEFAEDWTPDKLTEFTLLDANADGLLTAMEVSTSKAMMGGEFSNETAEVLPPKRTVISEIEIDEDLIVGDLNVQLSITHTFVGHLDAFLTGPEGQRVELFTEIGGSGDHFEETVFDDQSDRPINKARPPFEGRHLTEAKARRQPGLEQFNGTSARGVWQLVIRGTRSDRFGMLHRWALMIRPQEQMVGGLADATLVDGEDEQDESETSTFSFGGNQSDADDSKGKPTRSIVREGWPGGDVKQAKSVPSAWDRDTVDRYRQWAEKQKASGQPITAESKRQWLESAKSDANSRSGYKGNSDGDDDR
ncbi:proprotein convertase P-domain-containing protein [Crateriforma conspicua]|uniref:EF hand n=1 Tax=Crateriforma conspicua TaxID=2527996 RepID=A0A5C6G2T0_9PLAN|nr:proprotein convertase P-domain-containing protein [Crateriforma conspicua]TWU67700.1 EF hand [Crateriforma conspicua]